MKRSNLKYNPLVEDAEGNPTMPEPSAVPETAVPATVDEVRVADMTVKDKRALIKAMYEVAIAGNVDAADWIVTAYDSEADKVAAARAILDKS